jgi:LPS-assembly lipoprotein
MSWSNLRAALCALFAASLLAACGYTPLYGSMSGSGHGNAKITEAMKGLDVPQIPGGGLIGLDVRNGLLDNMGIDGNPVKPAQRLEVTLTPSLGGLLVQPDAAITRYNYTLLGAYRLVDTKDGHVLTEGHVYGQSAYNVVTSEYATVVARRDAERRAAQNVSTELATRIALYYKQ